MRVLIDALSARAGGGVTYLTNVLPALAAVADGHEYVVLCSARYQHDLMARIPASFRTIALQVEAEPLTRRWLALQHHVRRVVRDERIDLLFAPAENVYRRLPVPVVMMVRNLAIYRPPPSVDRKLQLLRYRALRKPLMHWALRAADELVFVSDAARREIVRIMGLPETTGRIIHHGVNEAFFTAQASGVARRAPYVLAVSTVTPHKNHEVLVRAIARLVRQGDVEPVDLLIAGDLKDRSTVAALRDVARREGIAERVHLLGPVPHDELPSLYAGAHAFAFPSRLETFGNPLLEAMAAGIPVVAADTPATREVCGDAAVLVDGASDDAFAAGLGSVVGSWERQEQLASRGRAQAALFTWNRTAARLSEAFDDALQGSSDRCR